MIKLIPMPKALTEPLKFGDNKQLEALWILKTIRGEEAKAEKLKKNYQVVFFKGKKPLFEMTVANKNIADNIAIKMHDFDDKKWDFDKIRHGKMKGGS